MAKTETISVTGSDSVTTTISFTVPEKGDLADQDIFAEWQNALKQWATKVPTHIIDTTSYSDTYQPFNNLGDAIDTSIKNYRGTLIGSRDETTLANPIGDSTINDFFSLMNDDILNTNANDRTEMWSELDASFSANSDGTAGVSASLHTSSRAGNAGSAITVGDAILDIPNTMKKLASVVKCYNQATNSYGDCTQGYNNYLCSNGENSNQSNSNAQNQHGTCSSGTRSVYSQSITNTQTNYSKKCTCCCTHGSNSHGTCTSGTCSSGTCTSGICTHGGTLTGTYEHGTCSSGLNSNSFNNNGDLTNGTNQHGTCTSYHSPITNTYASYTQSGLCSYNGNSQCSEVCTQNNKCSWSNCNNGINSNADCTSGKNSHGTCSSGACTHGTNSNGATADSTFYFGDCTSGLCSKGVKVDIRCANTTNSNTTG